MIKERPLDSKVKTSGLLTGYDGLSFYPQRHFQHTLLSLLDAIAIVCVCNFFCATYAALTGSLEIYKSQKTLPQKQKQKASV